MNGVEKSEVELIDFLRKTYYSIVCKTLQDLVFCCFLVVLHLNYCFLCHSQVPKSIMTFMVNDVKKNLKQELFSKLLSDETEGKLLEILLSESKDVCRQRQNANDMLAALKKAKNIIKEVDGYQKQ